MKVNGTASGKTWSIWLFNKTVESSYTEYGTRWESNLIKQTRHINTAYTLLNGVVAKTQDNNWNVFQITKLANHTIISKIGNDTSTVMNNSIIAFINYGFETWDNNIWAFVDWARERTYTDFIPTSYFGSEQIPNQPSKYFNIATNVSNPHSTIAVLHSVNWTDDTNLSGYIFSSNYSGSWANDSFVVITGVSNWSNVTKAMPNSLATFGWRVYANNSGNAWNETGIQTITTTNQAPQVSLNLPANLTTFNDMQNINLNFTGTDEFSETLNCSIYLDDILNQNNESTYNNTLTNFLINGISYGYHNWTINCSDDFTSNYSNGRFFWINDTLAPSIYFNTNTDISGTYNKDSIFVNITCSDPHKDTVMLNWQGINETFDNNIDNFYWENKTVLSFGIYNFYAWCNDTLSNMNQTETRTVILSDSGSSSSSNCTDALEVGFNNINSPYVIIGEEC
jgi:hypothetical protein